MNKYLIFGFFFLYSSLCAAQNPTIVFGKAATPDGNFNSLILEQPENAENPLGNPIDTPNFQNQPDNTEEEQSPQNSNQPEPQASATTNQNIVSEYLPINPQPSSEYNLKKEQSMIQDKLYEYDNRIYDIQSIPVKDIQKIEEPNIEPTITTYPIY